MRERERRRDKAGTVHEEIRAGIMEPGQRAVWASTSEKSPLAEREKKRERGTGGVPSAG